MHLIHLSDPFALTGQKRSGQRWELLGEEARNSHYNSASTQHTNPAQLKVHLSQHAAQHNSKYNSVNPAQHNSKYVQLSQPSTTQLKVQLSQLHSTKKGEKYKPSTTHSLIITREGLILTLAISSTLRGWI